MRCLPALMLTACLVVPCNALAEIVAASPSHFVLRHEKASLRSAAELWRRLVEPASWWHPDHTYSGDSNNLSLDLRAGGLWLEEWRGGSVEHGRVLYVEPGRLLRLEAPFGPLQGLGAYTIWTITIESNGDGSVVVFDEVSTGPPDADMATVAGAVDYVKNEAIGRLTH